MLTEQSHGDSNKKMNPASVAANSSWAANPGPSFPRLLRLRRPGRSRGPAAWPQPSGISHGSAGPEAGACCRAARDKAAGRPASDAASHESPGP